MNKIILIILFAVFLFVVKLSGQSFDWNLRGGLNLMNSKTSGKDVAMLYHCGGQVGLRIASYGLYAETIYSMHEDQNDGGTAIAYIIPSVIAKGFWRKYLFVELGGSFLSIIQGADPNDHTSNPDKVFLLSAGLGLQFWKFQLSLRSMTKQSYGLMQGTIALKF